MLINKSAVVPSLFGVFITTDSIYCGIGLVEIELPQKCSLLGLVREGQVISLQNNPVIHPGDYILAIARNPIMLFALEVTLKKIYSVYEPNKCLV